MIDWPPARRGEAIAWAKDMFGKDRVDTGILGNYIYLETEQEATLFVLRWS